MKKVFFGVLIGIVFVLILTKSSFAAGFGSALGNLDQAVGSKSGVGLQSDITVTISSVIKGVLALVGTIFLILTIYAGILWMTASGNEEQVGTARKILSAAIIGMFITMSAYTITYFVGNRLSNVGQGNAQPPAPQIDSTCTNNKNSKGVAAVCQPVGKCNFSLGGQLDCGQGNVCCGD